MQSVCVCMGGHLCTGVFMYVRVCGELSGPGHELVKLLLLLLVLGGDGMLGLLLHALHKVLHVLERVNLYERGRGIERKKGRY